MKVAIISEEYLPLRTGVTVNLHKKLLLLSQWGHEVHIYSPDYTAFADKYPNYQEHVGQIMPNVTNIPFASFRSPLLGDYCNFSLSPRPFSYGKVEKDIRDFQPDIIQVDSPGMMSLNFLALPGVKIARKLKIPVIAFYRTHFLLHYDIYQDEIIFSRIPLFKKFSIAYWRYAYNKYSITMVTSKATQQQLQKWKINNTKLVDVIGVQTEKFKPLKDYDKLFAEKSQKGYIKLLYIGRIDDDKQIETLLKIFDRVNEKVTNCRFDIFGHGMLEQQVKGWVAKKDNAFFGGSLPNLETVKEYNSADIFVTASNMETFCTTAVEAMACGLPVVGPSACAMQDRIVDGKTGFLLKDGDIEAFANAIEKLVSDSVLRKEMGRQAYLSVQKLSNENTTKNMVEMWEQMIAEKSN